MRYPEFLKDNGRIGFIAPSYGATTEPYYSKFKETIKRFEDKGYETVLGPNCFEDKGVGKSNTPEECGKEVNDFFLNDKCDVIISCGGGETMCEDLPYISFEKIAKAEPKWYMGYSDNTNLTLTLPTLADTAAIYGPCAASFGTHLVHPSVVDAFELLRGNKLCFSNYDLWELEQVESEDPLADYNLTEPFNMKIVGGENNAASFSGRMIGGCLDCMTILCGTKFDKVKEFTQKYSDDGIIFFFEACELDPMGVRRILWQLDNAGWFENVKGFLVGRPRRFNEEFMGLDRFSGVTSILEKYNVPIIFDIDLGHLPPMMPFISGAYADVTANNNSICIKYDMK